MASKKIESLFIEQLEELYDNEKQIVIALKKLQKEASTDDLKKAYGHHLSETKGQVRRLERSFKELNITPKKRPNKVTKELLSKAKEIIKEIEKSELRDVALIGASQKVEHFEISSYGTARALARLLGFYEIGNLLKESLSEEEEADSSLNKIAEGTFLSKGLNAIALKKEKEHEIFADETKTPKKVVRTKKKRTTVHSISTKKAKNASSRKVVPRSKAKKSIKIVAKKKHKVTARTTKH